MIQVNPGIQINTEFKASGQKKNKIDNNKISFQLTGTIKLQSMDLPGGPVVKTACLRRRGFSLVGKLRFPHATHGMAKRKKKNCNPISGANGEIFQATDDC